MMIKIFIGFILGIYVAKNWKFVVDKTDDIVEFVKDKLYDLKNPKSEKEEKE